MTNNYHTVLGTNAPLNASVIESRLSELDSGITGLAAGTTALENLNLEASGTLTINGGAVVKTGSQHLIDTEASASTDDLTTINGYATGDRLIISAANSSRVVTVKHGTGNIWLTSKMDFVLDDTDKTLEFIYRGGRWEQVNGVPTTAVTYPTTAPWRRPYGMPLMMTPAARNSWGWKAAAATIQATGLAAPTSSGTLAAANQTDSTYISMTTAASAGNSAGYVTATYNLVRRSHNPKFSAVVQIGDVTAVRYYFGLVSSAVSNADTQSVSAAVFRLSSVAGDTGFVPITCDGSTQTTGTAMNTTAANTRVLLEIELTASAAIFTINNGTPTIITTTLPATSTELGVNTLVFTTAAVAKVWYLSRVFVEYD